MDNACKQEKVKDSHASNKRGWEFLFLFLVGEWKTEWGCGVLWNNDNSGKVVRNS